MAYISKQGAEIRAKESIPVDLDDFDIPELNRYETWTEMFRFAPKAPSPVTRRKIRKTYRVFNSKRKSKFSRRLLQLLSDAKNGRYYTL